MRGLIILKATNFPNIPNIIIIINKHDREDCEKIERTHFGASQDVDLN